MFKSIQQSQALLVQRMDNLESYSSQFSYDYNDFEDYEDFNQSFPKRPRMSFEGSCDQTTEIFDDAVDEGLAITFNESFCKGMDSDIV